MSSVKKKFKSLCDVKFSEAHYLLLKLTKLCSVELKEKYVNPEDAVTV